MRLLWVAVVSIIGFFAITTAVFVTSSPYVYGNPVSVYRLSCRNMPPSQLQILTDYYQPGAPLYAKYFLWLAHSLFWQGQPALACGPNPILESSTTDFEVGIAAWIILTIALFLYVRARPSKSSASFIQSTNTSSLLR